MKQFFNAVTEAAKELTKEARVRLIAGACLLVLFALAGMVLTLKYWGPAACAAVLAFFLWWVFEKYNAHIPPARKKKIVETVSAAVASALADKLPYKFDPATAADVAYSVQIMRDGGTDVAAVCLLMMEKNPEKIDMRLVRHVFQNRFNSFCRSPGFAECAYSAAYPLLTVADVKLVGHDLTLYVAYADNGAAAHYLDGMREKLRKDKEQEAQKHNTNRLGEDDFL